MAGKLTEEQRSEACELYLNGESSTKLSKKYNITETSMIKCLTTRGITIRSKKSISKEQEIEIITLYQSGKSTPQISDILNYSARGIAKILIRNNIKLRSAPEAHRIYPLNTNFFDIIDTEEKAYIIGFIAADGCILNTTISINIKQSDKDILYKIAKYLFPENSEGRVKLRTRTDGGRYFEEATLNINSIQIVEKLINIGITRKKSLTLKYPKFSNDINIHKWFIRGYYDGDGGGTKDRNCKIIGTLEVCSEIKKIIFEQTGINFGIHQHHTEDNKNIWILVLGGNRQKKIFLDWLYGNATIYLDRKFNQYLNILKNIEDVNKKALAGTRGFRKQLVDPNLGIKSKFDENDKKLIFTLLEKGYNFKQIEIEYLLNRKEISKLVKENQSKKIIK